MKNVCSSHVIARFFFFFCCSTILVICNAFWTLDAFQCRFVGFYSDFCNGRIFILPCMIWKYRVWTPVCGNIDLQTATYKAKLDNILFFLGRRLFTCHHEFIEFRSLKPVRRTRPCKFFSRYWRVTNLELYLLFKFFFFQFSLVCQWSKLSSTHANTSYWSTIERWVEKHHTLVPSQKTKANEFNGHREQDVFFFLNLFIFCLFRAPRKPEY